MDGRRNNGGNSTKAKGFDKRKNPYRQAIKDAFSDVEVINVLRKMYTQSVDKGDVQATKVFLEYTVGKPKEEVSIALEDGSLNINLRDLLDFGEGSTK